MSFARGDLARRAALADNLAVPEPWSGNDDPRVFSGIRDLRDEFRQLGITDEDGKGRLPDFLLDYENLPPIKPTTLDRAHTRNSAATRWDRNGNLVQDSSDTLRLQRDPKTQAVEGLLYEPTRTQELGNPSDLSAATTKINFTVNDNVTTQKALSGDGMIEGNDSSSTQHKLVSSFTTSSDDPVAVSWIVEKNGRDYAFLKVGGNGNGEVTAYFDLANGNVGQTGASNGGSFIESPSITDLGSGLYRCKMTAAPASGTSFGGTEFFIAKGDGDNFYNGNGSDGLLSFHRQIEVSREVTSPILSGNATRGADAVNYGFSFPDKTTGVACSIEQQTGNDPDFSAFMRFGDTLLPNNQQHGILMDDRGLNANPGDGFKTLTRNSDDTDSEGVAPTDQTITNFQVDLDQGAKPKTRRPVRTVRQIAIHTTPHTQKQKDTLRDQYLTQP